MKYATRCEYAQPKHGDDRVAVIIPKITHPKVPNRVVFVVVDGAGGATGASAAADTVVESITNNSHKEIRPDWTKCLIELDRTLVPMGRAATIVAEVWENGYVFGACAGDGQIWTFGEKRQFPLDLLACDTQLPGRKPLLGEGSVTPHMISTSIKSDLYCPGIQTLVMATDGLWKYCDQKNLAKIISLPDVEEVASALVETVKLPNGKLQDDIALIVVRV